MATTDVLADVSEEYILYDLMVYEEWKQENEVLRPAFGRSNQVSSLNRITTSVQRTGWTVLRSLGLPIQSASPCNLPPNLVKLVNSTINWHLAVASDGSLVAIMQDQSLEIRSKHDDFATVTGRACIERDGHPQWRHLVWSPDNTMLACSFSSGVVEIYDVIGTRLSVIPGRDTVAGNTGMPSDLSEAVAALFFTNKVPDGEWSSELLVVNYLGKLSSYKVHRDKGHELQHTFVFGNSYYPLGVSCTLYNGDSGIIYVGGYGHFEESIPKATSEGLTAWRILSDWPHYKLVTDYADDLNMAQKQKSLRSRLKFPNLAYLKGETHDGIYKMSLSPDGRSLMCVHFSGKLTLWSVPGLKLLKSWPEIEQPFCDDTSPEFLENPQLRKQMKDLVMTKAVLDINWWSNEAVIMARGTGAVTVSSAKTLKNLLGNQPEWFEPAPRLSEVHNGGFLGLEVECRLTKKRHLLLTNDEDESDDEEAGLLSKSWNLTKQCLYYVTDADSFSPPKKKPKLVNRTYRLVCLKSTTPEELFARKLENEEYGEAKALAQAYNLNTDLVYQRQWRKAPVEISSIQDYLSKISKRAWVLHECTERISDKIDAMRELLQFGLRGTDPPALIMIGKGEDKGRYILCDLEDGLYEDMEFDQFDLDLQQKKDRLKQEKIKSLLQEVDFKNMTLEQRELCKARKKLVQYLYRLQTYEHILGGVSYAAERYDPKVFETFRSQNIVQIALEYAQNSDWGALEILFTFHGEEILPHRLAVLSNIPESTNPSIYKLLLPKAVNGDVLPWPVDRWMQPDWVEIEPCKSILDPTPTDLGDFLYEQQPELLQYRNVSSSTILTDWYQCRARNIECLSKQVDNALELIKIGIEYAVQGLDQILDDLITMEMLIYSCHVDENFTFSELQEMTDYDKLELIMSKSSDEMYTKNLGRWMVPFLKQCDRHSPGSYMSLLRDYIITISIDDLTRPLKIFQSSKMHLPNTLIPRQEDLLSLAVDSIYSCQRDDQLHLANDILKCLPQKGYGVDTKEMQTLYMCVDKLKNHLFVAKVLEDYGIKKPVFYVKNSESNADEAEQLMVRLTRAVSKRDGVITEAHWYRLHGEMMELQSKVYNCLSANLCHEIFVQSLLCSSNVTHIHLAGSMIERSKSEPLRSVSQTSIIQYKVPYHRSVQLVLAAAQEYFNSSANLMDVCMVLARSCLNLIEDSPTSIQEELDLVSSLTLLEEFGLPTLPLQVRLCKDRLELVNAAVCQKSFAYKQKQKLLHLGNLLRIPASGLMERDNKVLHIVARAAFKNDDFQFAYEVCQELIASVHGPAWDVCVDLAVHTEFSNVEAKVKLLSFAVTFCSPDMIEPILQARALLETQALFQGISAKIRDPSDESSRQQTSMFSTAAALKQTKHILTATKQTTKAVLSTVTDSKWWHGTMSSLHLPTNSRKNREEHLHGNKKLDHLACHPFYEGIFENCYSSMVEMDFSDMQVHVNPEIETREKLLRTALLEELLTEGEKTHTVTDVLLQLANDNFFTDNTLSLAYLLALKEPLDAEMYFTELPRTDLSLQLALYYYALQLYRALRCDVNQIAPIYLHDSVTVMQKVTSLVSEKDIAWPPNVASLVARIKDYHERLQDYRQAIVLTKLDRGIDTERFLVDSEYRMETICGLAMGSEHSVYNISINLAERYGVPLWNVHATHLEFLFCDSGLPVEELQIRTNKLGILDNLKSEPARFCDHMRKYVYPSLSGTDHKLLIYYYTMMLGCGLPLQGGLTAEDHVKLLKKLKPFAEGLDYKRLLDKEGNVIDVLSPCLSSSNIALFAKHAKQIPDGTESMLDASVVYCTWAVKFFWEGDGKKKPDNKAGWLQRYEACGEYIQKLHSENIPQFLQAIIFTEQSRTLLELDCRIEICSRLLKFCQQQSGKKKPKDSDGKLSWESAAATVSDYLKHLRSMDDPVLVALSKLDVVRMPVYMMTYDISMGSSENVHNLLISMVLEGELPLNSMHKFLTVVAIHNWTLDNIVRDSVEYIKDCLSKRCSPVKPLKDVQPLSSLEKVVMHVQEYIENGGHLIVQDDLLSWLRPFCSDTSVDVQSQLDVLYILEKNFKLSDEDSVLLILYRTQAVAMEIWPDLMITEGDIKSTSARLKLFYMLLGTSSNATGSDAGDIKFPALCRLLHLWPPFPETSNELGAWMTLFKAMIESGIHDNVTLVVETVKSAKTSLLTNQDAELLYRDMQHHGFHLEAVKLCLMACRTEMFLDAMETFSQLPQIPEDPELLNLLMKHKLVPHLVSTPHYQVIVQYLLANQQSESHDYLSIETLANQLRDNGFAAEAGSLLLQSRGTTPMLQTFGAALVSVSQWFLK